MATRYAAIIDSGSSSSRMWVYSWTEGVKPNIKLIRNVVDGQEDAQARQTASSLHKVFDEVDEAQYADTMNAYLNPLVRYAKSRIPNDHHETTPIYLFATAGMRALQQDHAALQQAILLRARQYLNGLGVFREPNGTNVNVIPGQIEGVLAWIAFNWGWHANTDSVGLLEMGGQSLQIAHRAPDGEQPAGSRKVCLATTDIDNPNAPGPFKNQFVVSDSWDRYGGDAVVRRHKETLPLQENGRRRDPCLPPLWLENGPFPSNGTGDFNACITRMEGFLTADHNDGDIANVPHYGTVNPVQRFIGISNFYHTLRFFSGVAAGAPLPVYNYNNFLNRATAFCTTPFEGAHPPYSDKQCMTAAWILKFLHHEHGFEMPLALNNNRAFRAINADARRSSWTIGAAVMVAQNGDVLSEDGWKFCPDPVEDDTWDSIQAYDWDHSSTIAVEASPSALGATTNISHVACYGLAALVAIMLALWRRRKALPGRSLNQDMEQVLSAGVDEEKVMTATKSPMLRVLGYGYPAQPIAL